LVGTLILAMDGPTTRLSISAKYYDESIPICETPSPTAAFIEKAEYKNLDATSK